MRFLTKGYIIYKVIERITYIETTVGRGVVHLGSKRWQRTEWSENAVKRLTTIN